MGWTSRMVRRGTLVLTLASVGYMALEVVSFERTYPNGVSPEQFAIFVDNPAARMLQGVPHDLDSVGALAIWDGGWVLSTIVAVWALLVVSRLMRGEEETQRSEMFLVGPLGPRRVTSLVLLVVVLAALLVGVGVAAGLVAGGAAATGSAIFGLAVVGLALTFGGVSAVASQIVDVRRRAAGITAGLLGVLFMVRMVANSTDERDWLGWFSPYGWLDRLRPYGDVSVPALALLVLTPLVLLSVAVLLRGYRDVGSALLTSADRHQANLRGLGGPTAFAWRGNRAVLIGWAVGLGAYAFMLGSLVTTVIDFVAEDADYRRLLEDLGLGTALTTDGFLGVMGVTLGVGFALYAAWRVGSARTEEESERAENLLARPVTRSWWLGGHAALTLVGTGLLILLTGLAMWLGAVATGSEDLGLWPAMQAVANTASVAVLVTGLALLTFGLVPRVTTAVPVAVTVAAYLLSILGPALEWPQAVLNLSPFTHLAYVPAEPFEVTPAVVMALIGVVAGVGGIAAFGRRDLKGA
jgi:ABC-2 type transport system permease protein